MDVNAFREKLAEIGIGFHFIDEHNGIKIDNMGEVLAYFLDQVGHLYLKDVTLYGDFLGLSQEEKSRLSVYENSLCANYIYYEENESELLLHVDAEILYENFKKNEQKEMEIGEQIIEGYKLKSLFLPEEKKNLTVKLTNNIFNMHTDSRLEKVKEYIEKKAYTQIT